MPELTEFTTYPKIPRLYREIIITEKLDGTNAHIVITDDPSEPILVGSRNRYITPGKSTDNYGFAEFIKSNEDMFRRLGPGRHYGEWWGCGIGRGYSLTRRYWSLFNTSKEIPEGLPDNVNHVPILYTGIMDIHCVGDALWTLQNNGSCAAPGYMNPEGVVVFHRASNQLFKVTLGGDGHKGNE